MKNILAVFSVCALLLAGAFAQQSEDDGSTIWAYQRYQEAMGGSEIEPVITYAKMAYERALEEWGDEKKETGLIASNYGDALLRGGEFKKAIKPLQKCEEILLNFQDEARIDLAICQMRLGQVHFRRDQRAKSKKAFFKTVETLSVISAPYDAEISSILGESYLGLAQATLPRKVRLVEQDDDFSRLTKKSKQYLDLAWPLLVAAYGEDHHTLAMWHFLYGLIHESARDWEQAAEAYNLSFEIREKIFGKDALITQSTYGRYRYADISARYAARSLTLEGPEKPNKDAKENCFEKTIGEEIISSCVVHREPPDYPSGAWGSFGYTLVTFTISEQGRLKDVEIIAAWPEGVFDNVVRRALAKWRYTPPVNEAGEPREIPGMETMMSFRIEN